MLVEALTGRRPFGHGTGAGLARAPAGIGANLPGRAAEARTLEQLLLRCVATDPRDRPGSVDSLRPELVAALLACGAAVAGAADTVDITELLPGETGATFSYAGLFTANGRGTQGTAVTTILTDATVNGVRGRSGGAGALLADLLGGVEPLIGQEGVLVSHCRLLRIGANRAGAP